MRSQELSNIFEKLSRILSCYEDLPVEKALDEILRTIKEQPSARKKKPIGQGGPASNQEITKDAIFQLSNMDTHEIVRYLSESEYFQSKHNLLELAEELSISVSSRTTISTIVHSIAKSFERNKLDHLIRNGRNPSNSLDVEK